MADVVGEVTLKGVRLSFADIFEPAEDREDKKTGETIKGRYKANGLMEKGTKLTEQNMAKLAKAKKDVIDAKWGKNPPKLKASQVCVRDGDEENWDGYEDHWYITASEKTRPVLITRRKDRDGKWIEAEPDDIYSGCMVNMVVQLWAQDHPEYGKRINANLKAIQFHEHNTPFNQGSRPVDPNEKFADIEEEDGGTIGGDDDDDSVI